MPHLEPAVDHHSNRAAGRWQDAQENMSVSTGCAVVSMRAARARTLADEASSASFQPRNTKNTHRGQSMRPPLAALHPSPRCPPLPSPSLCGLCGPRQKKPLTRPFVINFCTAQHEPLSTDHRHRRTVWPRLTRTSRHSSATRGRRATRVGALRCVARARNTGLDHGDDRRARRDGQRRGGGEELSEAQGSFRGPTPGPGS